jgi:hypothetical protein
VVGGKATLLPIALKRMTMITLLGFQDTVQRDYLVANTEKKESRNFHCGHGDSITSQ